MTALDSKCLELYSYKAAYINLGEAVNLSSEQYQGHVIRVFCGCFYFLYIICIGSYSPDLPSYRKRNQKGTIRDAAAQAAAEEGTTKVLRS